MKRSPAVAMAFALAGVLAAAENGPARMLTKEAWVLLADAYRRLGRYRQAAAAFRSVLDRFGPVLDDDERRNLEDQAGLWSALAGVPPQSVEVAADTVVRMTNRHLPVSAGRRGFLAGYDTGAKRTRATSTARSGPTFCRNARV